MAPLSHAPFATPNTQQMSPSHKLLPSHPSMDPASSSMSTLSQPYPSAELQKPTNARLPFDQLHSMSPFNNPYTINSPLYEGFSEAGDSIEQGFIGDHEPLLTSSWEALDKLVSASMVSSGVGNGRPDFMHTIAHASTVRSSSPSSITAMEMEQKPLNVSKSTGKVGVHNMWVNNQASANNFKNAYTGSSNVGSNLASLISPGFVERAAKYSSYSQQINQAYSTRHHNNMINITNALSLENFGVACARKLSSVSAAPTAYRGDNAAVELDVNSDLSAPKSSNISTPTTLETIQSTSPQGSMGTISTSKKKREAPTKDGEVDDARANVGRKKAKVGEKINDKEDTSNGKNNTSKAGKTIGGYDQKTKMQQSSSLEYARESDTGGKEIVSKPNGTNKNNISSSTQAPKPEFVHVRARRGQATDSHSLAERVRREKISERMKYLQDLVPGCTKVTGKAMMLDEIINYVQSLQRQVEFLSMKLAAVHPSKLEFNFQSLFGKEVIQQSIAQNNQSVSFTPENHANFKSYPLLQPQQPNHAFPESNISSCLHSFGSEEALQRTVTMLAAASSDTFADECISSQVTVDAWDEDLQNIVQLEIPQTPLSMITSLHDALLHGQMKIEL